MSFLGGLSNIFHSIGSLFDGGDDDEKKRQQQQQQQQQNQNLNLLPNQQNNSQQQGGQAPPPPQKLNLLQDDPLSTSLQKAKPQLSVQPTPQQPTVQVNPTPDQPLVKVAPSTPPPPAAHPSFLSKAGKFLANTASNAVQDVLGSGSAGETPEAIAAIRAGKPVQADQAGHDESIKDQALGALKTRLLFAAPAASLGKGALLKAANSLGLISGGYSAADSLTDQNTLGKSPVDIAKNTATNFGEGYGTGFGLGTLGKAVVSPLVKAARGALTPTSDVVSEAVSGEVSPGVTSTNPNQVEDAAQQSAHLLDTRVQPPGAPGPEPIDVATHQQLSQQLSQKYDQATKLAENMPPLKQKQFLDNLDQQTQAEQQKLDDALAAGRKTTVPVNDVTPQAPTAPVVEPATPTAAPVPTAEPAAPTAPAAAAQAVAESRPVAPAVDANGNPALVSDITTARQAEAAGVNPNPTPTIPPNGELKNARFNQAVVDNAKDPVFKRAFESDPIEKDGAPLSQINGEAIQRVQNMSLPELVQHYGADFADSGPVTNEGQYYEYLQALRQLEQHSSDPTAAQAAANALTAINDFAYRQGRGLAAVKLAYDDLPVTMKVAYVNKLVQRAGGELSAADAERLYNAAELQGKFAQTAQEIENRVSELSVNASKADPAFNKQMKTLLQAEHEAQSNLYDQNRVVVDILQNNLPKSALGDRIAQNARTMMLSSVGGRVFALTGTGFNVGTHLADSALSSIYGRGINAANKLLGRNGNAVKTSFDRPSTLVKGAVTGIKGLAKEVSDQAPVKSVDGYLRKPYDNEYSHDTTKYGALGKITAPFRKVVRFGVGTHLAATKGVETASLEQAARQAAKDINVPKENMQGFVDWYKSHPPKNVAEEAKQAWLGVNNLHRNGVSDSLAKMAGALESLGSKTGGKDGGLISGVAKQVRVVLMPFSHYMGGFFDKAITDRNMLYNVYRIARARSPQELSDQLAHLTTNTGMAIGGGYMLAKNGVITDKDQDGNSYEGLYFHVGNKYIPVGWAGQNAMPLIMGARFQIDQKGKGGVAMWAPHVLDDILKTTGVAGTFGSDSSVNNLLAGNSEQGGPKAAGAAIRQHIPGFFGDINAGLNRTGLNPTQEKPLTKATTLNPDTGKQDTNTLQTEINKTEAAIPGLSQQLPRDEGKKAPDLLDRMLHAGEASGQQIKADALKKVQLDQTAFDKANDIPDPNGKYSKGDNFESAVQARIDRGEYDKATKALQQKLDTYKGDNNVAKKTTDDIQNHIKELNVTKTYGQAGQDTRKLYLQTSLSEWRAMGDPESDSYDPTTYQKLYSYDSALAKQGVAGSGTDSAKNKFTAKKESKKSAQSRADKLVKDNTIGNLPELKNVSFGNLAPAKISNVKIPTVGSLKPEQMIKKRAISVSSVR